MRGDSVKKKVFILAILFSGVFTLWWLYGHSYIEVTVNSAGGDNFQISLTNQHDSSTKFFEGNGRTLKLLVGRSDYEVLVTRQESSQVKIVRTGGFLKKTSVSLDPQPEKHRSFIGDNPRFCTALAGSVMLSFNCGDAFDNIQLHAPATAKQASFTRKLPNTTEANILGTVTTKEGTFALIREPRQGEQTGSIFSIYPLRSDLELAGRIELPELQQDRIYNVTAYQDGFLLYDSVEYNNLLYFKTSKDKPVKLELSRPVNSKFKPYSLTTRGETVAIAYSDNTEGQVVDVHSDDTEKVQNEIHLLNNATKRTILINKQYSMIDLCGDLTLCLLAGNKMEVYSIRDDIPKFQHRVVNVQSIHRSGNTLLLARINDVLEYSTDQRTGYRQYSYGSYTFCGINTDLNGYTLCLINTKQKKVALRITPSQINTDSIDKKVLGLLATNGIGDVAAYGRFIHVVPNLGKITYQSNTDSFGYDSARKRAVSESLNAAIRELDIDQNNYLIINTISLD